MSKAPYENYQGSQVPPGHSALFRAMDQQERFYAEVMRMNEVSIKNALNQAAQKTIGELNAIRNNHLAAFDSKILNEIFLKTNDHIIGNLLKNNIAIDLSSNPAALANSYVLNRIKAQMPDFFKEYKEMYDYISHPLNVPTNDLLQIKTQAELEPIKNAFLQNLEYLNTYFAYTEGHNYQSPISEISCKEPLLEIVEDMGSKLDSF